MSAATYEQAASAGGTARERVEQHRWGRALVALLAGGALLAAQTAQGQSAGPGEYAVKAAFLYNFAKFIEWPTGAPTGPIKIGILGADPFGPTIDRMVKGKTAQDRPVVIRRLERAEHARSCHIVFVSKSEKGDVGEVLRTIDGAPVLTVADMDRFAQRGGMVGFYLQANKVRFEVNVKAAHRARLKISSKLLGVARIAQG